MTPVPRLLLLLGSGACATLLPPATRPCAPPRAAITASASSFPPGPDASLSLTDAIDVVCAGLQQVDEPSPNAGMERLYNFLTPAGRTAIAPPPARSGLQGGVTLDYFLEFAGSAALGSLIECVSFSRVGEPTISPGNDQGTRGRLATQILEVCNSPVAVGSDERRKALACLVSTSDEFLSQILQAHRDGSEVPPPPPDSLVRTRFVLKWEEERRPPHQVRHPRYWAPVSRFHL